MISTCKMFERRNLFYSHLLDISIFALRKIIQLWTRACILNLLLKVITNIKYSFIDYFLFIILNDNLSIQFNSLVLGPQTIVVTRHRKSLPQLKSKVYWYIFLIIYALGRYKEKKINSSRGWYNQSMINEKMNKDPMVYGY